MPPPGGGGGDATKASAVPYFYGRITREEAQNILTKNGLQEGLYLLRENISTAGNYVLSICHNNRIHHYSIERQPDGTYKIEAGRPFPGPVELILHHSQFLDGFLTKPKHPCARPPGAAPMAWPGVTMLELEQALLEEAAKQKLTREKLENVLGPQRQKFVLVVARRLHEEQDWFHGSIGRTDADNMLAKSGHRDGKFLVRQRNGESFALSISYQGMGKHYKIDRHKTTDKTGDKWAIEDGPKFDNLMDMVAHYYNKPDGLLCKLTQSCPKPGFKKKERSFSGANLNPIYGGKIDSPAIADSVLDETFDEPELPDGRPLPPLPPGVFPGSAMQKIYDSVPRTEDVFNLRADELEFTAELGNGNFGSVKQGIYRHRRESIPVAIKQLKETDQQSSKEELMREAKLMADLEHPNVVRMIGVCKAEPIMLVLELAALGPLNKYLKNKRNIFPVERVLILMEQVAEGMAYLESKNFVHRDLAARNVLLASEDTAKISDFGMSKALGIGNNYYKAETAGKWPLKWYAPECIYFFKFDSKSDVWSYGVTLWEATSYGDKPYKGLRGAQIIEMIDRNERMQRPQACPPQVYSIMLSCWETKSEKRPSFPLIVERMRLCLSNL